MKCTGVTGDNGETKKGKAFNNVPVTVGGPQVSGGGWHLRGIMVLYKINPSASQTRWKIFKEKVVYKKSFH